MTDTADRILDDLRRRRDELKPLVDELQRIEAAIDALERANGASPTTPRQSGGRRGRPRKGEPNRTDQFLDLVRNGGTSIPAAAQALGIGPNYLYRIAGTLEAEGTIRKEGREYVMAVDRPGDDDENAETLPQPDESESGSGGGNGGGDDLVTDEGVNEGTREIVEE
jgi:hypothetical protein